MNISPVETYNKLKLKALVLYIIKNLIPEKRSVYFIVKTVFLAHQRHLSEYFVPLLHDNIKALEFGPVPSDVYDALKIARGEEKVKKYHTHDALNIVWESISHSNERFSALEDPNMDDISPAALSCLNHALNMTNAMTFDEVVRTTHQKEWQRAFENPYDHVMDTVAIAREGGIDPDGLAYLEFTLETENILR